MISDIISSLNVLKYGALATDVQKEIDSILELMGSIFYDFGLVGPKFSLFAGTYQLPLVPDDSVLVVQGWLKVPIRTDILPKGVFLDDLSDPRLISALSVALGRNVETRQAPISSTLSIVSEKPGVRENFASDFEFWYFIELDRARLRAIKRFIPYDFSVLSSHCPPGMALPVPLGSTVGDKLLWFDFSTDFIGALVCGATRMGKSVAVRSWLSFWFEYLDPSMFRAYLADFKQGVEFFDFKDYNNASLYSDPDVFIQAVSGENNTRWGLIRNNDSKNIFEYNESVPFDMRLPYCIVVIDEVAMFKVKSSKNSATLLSALVAQTAGAGMYWLLSTQRPSVDIVNGSLKANLNCRISFSQATAVDSEVVFGEGIDNAVQLGNPGRGWCMVSDRFFEFQALFI